MLSRGANKTEGKGSETMTMTGRRRQRRRAENYRLPFRSTSIYLLHRSSKSEKPGQGNTADFVRRAQLRKQFKRVENIPGTRIPFCKIKNDRPPSTTASLSRVDFERRERFLHLLTSSRSTYIAQMEKRSKPRRDGHRAERAFAAGLKISCRGRHSRCR